VTVHPRTRPLPDFLCIGAQKAGTTWLYRNLKSHPEVWLPPEKEVHYFDKRLGEEGVAQGTRRRRSDRRPRRTRLERNVVDGLRNLSPSALGWHVRNSRAQLSPWAVWWRLRYFLGRASDDWYTSLFRPGADRVTGDMTPAYAVLTSERVARVRRLIPTARIIFFMRNPIERSWSHAGMHARQGHVHERDEAIRLHFRSATSLLRTNYIRTLETWSVAFPADQIFVGFLEDIRFHPRELLNRLCFFLGLTPIEEWPYLKDRVYSRSEATIPVSFAVELAMIHDELTAELSRRFGGYATWWRYCRDRVVGLEPSGELPFPFYDGPLWADWLANNTAEPQSDTLARTTRGSPGSASVYHSAE
jgi:hypothetical protein